MKVVLFVVSFRIRYDKHGTKLKGSDLEFIGQKLADLLAET